MSYSIELYSKEKLSNNNNRDTSTKIMFEIVFRTLFKFYFTIALYFSMVFLNSVELNDVHPNNVLITFKIFMMEVFILCAVFIFTTTYSIYVNSINYSIIDIKFKRINFLFC